MTAEYLQNVISDLRECSDSLICTEKCSRYHDPSLNCGKELKRTAAKILENYYFDILDGAGRRKKTDLKDSESSAVVHPEHYNSGSIEVWDAIVDWGLDFLLGNVVKYAARAGKKDNNSRLQDLEKARAYIERAIEDEHQRTAAGD